MNYWYNSDKSIGLNLKKVAHWVFCSREKAIAYNLTIKKRQEELFSNFYPLQEETDAIEIYTGGAPLRFVGEDAIEIHNLLLDRILVSKEII
jgi:hypothetical protein